MIAIGRKLLNRGLRQFGIRGPWSRLVQPTAQAPLLDEHEILLLYQQARSGQWNQPVSAVDIAHARAGESRSVFHGRGWDFEENRLYQAGDELRFMNWRLTARMGEPYMKVFREERRPSTFIVMDRRSSMRFGTRRQLKVSQAARVAAIAAFRALNDGMAVGAFLMQRQSCWIPERGGRVSVMELVRALAAACPPVLDVSGEPSLQEALGYLQTRLVQGTQVLLIGDFSDLSNDHLPLLLQLNRNFPTSACQILDPAELDLPHAGRVDLETVDGGYAQAVDTMDGALRERYARLARTHLDQRRRLFSDAGIEVRTVMTDQDLQPA